MGLFDFLKKKEAVDTQPLDTAVSATPAQNTDQVAPPVTMTPPMPTPVTPEATPAPEPTTPESTGTANGAF